MSELLTVDDITLPSPFLSSLSTHSVRERESVKSDALLSFREGTKFITLGLLLIIYYYYYLIDFHASCRFHKHKIHSYPSKPSRR